MDARLDLSVICRTCLSISARTISIFTKDLTFELSLLTMLGKVSSLEFAEMDGMPEKVCYSCAEQLRGAYEFQQMCIRSLGILLKHRENHRNTERNQELPSEEFQDHISIEDELKPDPDDGNICYTDEDYLEESLLDDDQIKEEVCGNADRISTSCTIEASEAQDSTEGVSVENIELHILNHEDEHASTLTESKGENGNKNSSEDENPDKDERKCPICGRVLSKKSHLTRHMRSHSQTKSYQCTQCSKCFTRADNLQEHIQNHSESRNFPCRFCKHSFKREFSLKKHLAARHKDFVEANFHVCSVCNRFFDSEAKLNKHSAIHEQEKDLVCDLCGARFAEQFRYTMHRQKHEKDNFETHPHLCSLCGKRFSRKSYLTVHLRRHAGDKRYKCKYCDKGFPRKTDLNAHENYHTGKKAHLCTTCGKRFHQLYLLKTHMRTHSGEKPYKCERCPKAFNDRSGLSRHVRSRHTGERFKCDTCEDQFLHAHQLNHHLSSVHNRQVERRTRRVVKVFTKQPPTDENSTEPK